MFYEDEQSLQRQIEIIEGVSDKGNLHWVNVPFPERNGKLSRTDWSIVGASQMNPRRSYVEISRELVLSSRTVKRRAKKMVDAGASFAIPRVNVRHVAGVLIVVLVFYDSPSNKDLVNGKIFSRLEDHVLVAELGYVDQALFVMYIPNI